jgi:hypothetical protein
MTAATYREQLQLEVSVPSAKEQLIRGCVWCVRMYSLNTASHLAAVSKRGLV